MSTSPKHPLHRASSSRSARLWHIQVKQRLAATPVHACLAQQTHEHTYNCLELRCAPDMPQTRAALHSRGPAGNIDRLGCGDTAALPVFE